ncbi:efflux RND transporter permease subunit [uncultured Tenacibaculum sp.]|uniref:efflux RND transporter permease subunit n=1 Tax=uncultured Tenacibaculum sp. TaxID=174713 RepID=UPI00262F325F|nr:efflux RND transporter permease subunit [uncultured Tenacibaculum sp.]
MEKNNKLYKEFGLSSWAIENKTTVWVIIALILGLGLIAYSSMPRENFPEIKETKIYVSAIYPGNTAEDIEKLIIDPLEEKLKNVSNVIEIKSTAQEDFGMLIVEFDDKLTIEGAKQKVKDEVDRKTASEDWPTFNGAKVEPNIFNINIAEEASILNINIAGDYPVNELQDFGEYLEDEIENLPEIKQVDIRGAEDQEIEVAVDIYKMMAAKISFNNVINSIKGGNITISAGNLINSGQRRTIRMIGEVKSPKDLNDFVVKSDNGSVYLQDIATVTFKDKDKTTFAREFGSQVVMLEVKKRSGQNMVAAVDKIKVLVKNAQENVLPKDIKITLANDQSQKTMTEVDDLVNNIIFGIMLVVGVLMFFLGIRNALFVGLAIPMSMFLSFIIIDLLGYTLNTMILFGLVMGLGMLVDNGIVVVENVYRLMEEEGMSRFKAAKQGIGEIAFPIIISTATTVAAFVPLGMWPGEMGEFMIYFPVTLSIVLGSSLFVAIFINSMLVSRFMKTTEKKIPLKQLVKTSIILVIVGILILIVGKEVRSLGVILLFSTAMLWGYRFLFSKMIIYFQTKILTTIETWYERMLIKVLSKKMPAITLSGTFALLIIIFMMFGASVDEGKTKIEFFPDNIPFQIITYIEYPQGTDITKTNTITKKIENRIYQIINQDKYLDPNDKSRNQLVESVVSQVGRGAGNHQVDGFSDTELPHKGKITLTMREFKYRNGLDSRSLRKEIQEAIVGVYPGVAISVEKNIDGPAAGYPINLELSGKNYETLIETAETMRDFINTKSIPGIAELKIDVNKGKPIKEVIINRKKAGELGINADNLGMQLRSSIFGTKAGIYKKDGDDYDIYVRFNKDNRYNTSALFNQNITFRDENSGAIKEVPVSAIASQINTSGFSAIKHKNSKRVVTMYSSLAPGFTDAGQVVTKIREEMESINLPKGVSIDYTGQIEEEAKEMAFLMGAFFTGLALIFLILIYQFNSVTKPGIIMIAVFLSFIGVFGGILISGASFVILMTMLGIISLAGIVVNNGVILLDYTQLLIDRKKEQLNISNKNTLDLTETIKMIVKGGKSRLRPVLLTAITTVLGLMPLAYGININFFTLFSEFDANIYIGGDNVVFWGPLAKTVIYGLIVATFLTLVIVPVLFMYVNKVKIWKANRAL